MPSEIFGNGKGISHGIWTGRYGVLALEPPSPAIRLREMVNTMKRILIGFCALSLCAGLVPKISAQTITITVGPAADNSYWIWNDEYQVWVWNGPEFQGDYEGHPYSYWHGRHEGDGDRNHRPGKGERSEGEHPVNKDNVEQPR